MKFSIVTLSFNQKPFLRQALESVLNQNHANLQYIVVDPGSTDGSRELINEYADKLAKRIFEPDQGAADGLNKGFAAADGDILAFLNADDLLLPGSLSAVESCFQENPSIGILMGNGFVIDAEGERIRHIKARGFTLRRYLHGGCKWLQQSTFFRRSIFERSTGFNAHNRTCWDGELIAGMVGAGAQVHYLDCDLAAFRLHSTSISGSGTNFERYRADTRRIFRSLQGREWNVFDDGLRAVYRAEGLMRRVVFGQ